MVSVHLIAILMCVNVKSGNGVVSLEYLKNIFFLIGVTLLASCQQSEVITDWMASVNPKFNVTFGQLLDPGDRVAHFTEIQIPSTLSVPTPTTGTVRYRASLDDLSKCLIITPVKKLSMSAIKLTTQPGLPKPSKLFVAICNLENGAGEIAADVKSYFISKGYSDAPNTSNLGNKSDAQIATDGFLADDSNFAPIDVTLDEETPTNTTLLGTVSGGRLQIVAYELVNDTLGDVDSNRKYVNAMPYLSPYLTDPILRAQAPVIVEAVIEASPNADMSGASAVAFDVGTWTAPTAVDDFIRLKLKLAPHLTGTAKGPTVSPYAISYTLRRAGFASVVSHGEARMNSISYGDKEDRRNHLFSVSDSTPNTNTYWQYLVWDTTSLASSSTPEITDATDVSDRTILDLTQALNGGPALNGGAYELELEVRDVFTKKDLGNKKVLKFFVDGMLDLDLDADKADLTKLIIRKIDGMPASSSLKLSVQNNDKIRIFDQHDNAVIGPKASDGGPDIAYHIIPNLDIIAADLPYLIEAVHGGNQKIKLEMFDGSNNLVRSAEIDVALNVFYEPGGEGVIRNRVTLLKSNSDLLGLKAKLEGNKPIVSWDPSPPEQTTTSYWISMQSSSIDHWLQTGVRIIRNADGTESENLYFEFVPDYHKYILPESDVNRDPFGYQVKSLTGSNAGWTEGEFKVEVSDRSTGETKVWHKGISWWTLSHSKFKTAVFDNYQIGTEPKQTIARIPGTSADKALVSDVETKNSSGWLAASFNSTDIELTSVDGNGIQTTKSTIGSSNSANLEGMHFEWKSSNKFELWDERQ